MRARTAIVVEAGGRLTRLDCTPPLTVRRVGADDVSVCALCLVGTAAGPLAGDDLHLDLDVRAGASATLQAAGASIAQGGGGARSLRTTATIGTGGRLVAAPPPLIVAHRCHVDVAVTIDLAADAVVEWHEVVVLGRSDEPPGAATIRWDVTRAGRPVLRQFVDLADPALARWAGMTGGARVLATSLVSDPARTARTVVHGPYSVTAKLDDHTTLTTTLARQHADLPALRALAETPG